MLQYSQTNPNNVLLNFIYVNVVQCGDIESSPASAYGFSPHLMSLMKIDDTVGEIQCLSKLILLFLIAKEKKQMSPGSAPFGM